MLKTISKIDGAQELTINEQKIVRGGGPGEFIVCCPEDNNIAYPDCRYIECSR
jgi:hypothetical protein